MSHLLNQKKKYMPLESGTDYYKTSPADNQKFEDETHPRGHLSSEADEIGSPTTGGQLGRVSKSINGGIDRVAWRRRHE